jgi:hypothetical protein
MNGCCCGARATRADCTVTTAGATRLTKSAYELRSMEGVAPFEEAEGGGGSV